jgi:hypothetical protein
MARRLTSRVDNAEAASPPSAFRAAIPRNGLIVVAALLNVRELCHLSYLRSVVSALHCPDA